VVPEWQRPQAEAYMALVDGAVHTVRSLREKFHLEPKAKPALFFVCKTEEAQKTLQAGAQVRLPALSPCRSCLGFVTCLSKLWVVFRFIDLPVIRACIWTRRSRPYKGGESEPR
jgi:hypothetical protein